LGGRSLGEGSCLAAAVVAGWSGAVVRRLRLLAAQHVVASASHAVVVVVWSRRRLAPRTVLLARQLGQHKQSIWQRVQCGGWCCGATRVVAPGRVGCWGACDLHFYGARPECPSGGTGPSLLCFGCATWWVHTRHTHAYCLRLLTRLQGIPCRSLVAAQVHVKQQRPPASIHKCGNRPALAVGGWCSGRQRRLVHRVALWQGSSPWLLQHLSIVFVKPLRVALQHHIYFLSSPHLGLWHGWCWLWPARGRTVGRQSEGGNAVVVVAAAAWRTDFRGCVCVSGERGGASCRRLMASPHSASALQCPPWPPTSALPRGALQAGAGAHPPAGCSCQHPPCMLVRETSTRQAPV
jgi:hypothetical protein